LIGSGTGGPVLTTNRGMTCAWCREALSALLDGEDDPGERAEVDAHLVHCVDCRGYSQRAARITRLARTEPVSPMPDFATPAVLDGTPAPSAGPAPVLPGAAEEPPSVVPGVVVPAAAAVPGVPAVRRQAPARVRPVRGHGPAVLRVLLALIGVGQLGLAARELFGAFGGTFGTGPNQQPGGTVNGAGLTQLVHESSAWNLALAVGFLCVAARPARTRAVLPLVGAFVAWLAVLSAVDAAHGRLIGSRLVSHSGVLAGLFVLLALARLAGHPGEDTPHALGGPGPAPGGPGSWSTTHPPERMAEAGWGDLEPGAGRPAA
jgi:predicted anti-sigma-YlaC factor YlaD